MTLVIFLLSPLLTQPCAAHATLCPANASVIPSIHEMVPPCDRTRIGFTRFDGSQSCSSEMLNLNNKTPLAACPTWCALAEEANYFYNQIDPQSIPIRLNLAAEFENITPILNQSVNWVIHPQVFTFLDPELVYPVPKPAFSDSKITETKAAVVAHDVHDQIQRLLAQAALARARIKHYIMMGNEMLVEALMSAHMLIMSVLCFPFVYAPLLLLVAGVFAVVIDVAKAVVGLCIHIAGLAPHSRSSHAMIMTFIDRILLRISCALVRIILSRVFTYILALFWILSYLPSVEATGRETPKVNFMEYFLPGVTRWDAIPYHDFRRVWWVALCAALGNVNQEGYSLLQTARDQDLGAPGNPGTPAQTLQSNNRNHRLFGAILNYIEATSYLYHYVSTNFNNDGRGLFQYLYVYGDLPYTTEERLELESEWKESNMANVGIKYMPNAVFKWAEYVNTLASKLGKSEREKRIKYLQGFPNSFDVLVVAERARPGAGAYTHPALYPAHHPQAGAAHPLAGQPDIDAMAIGFYGEWSRMVNQGLIKSIPKGFAGAHRVDDPSCSSGGSDNDEHACMTRDRVSNKSVCGVCGGIGHAGKVNGVGSCLTAKLGNRVPNEDLNRIQYPDGYNPPSFLWRSNAGPSRSNQRSNYFSNANTNPRSRHSNHAPSSLKARMVEEPPSPPPEFEPCNECTFEDDEAYAHDLQEAIDAGDRARRMLHHNRQRARPNPYARKQPMPHRRSAVIRPKPRARASDAIPPQEPLQNSTRDADTHESDEDEHGRLAARLCEVTFQ